MLWAPDSQRHRRAHALEGCAAVLHMDSDGDTAIAGVGITARVLFLPSQSYTFLISSDYERAEWRENIREQQKKCKCLRASRARAWERQDWMVT